MNNCKICNNPLVTRRVKSEFTGPLGRVLYEKQSYCGYCEWKGTLGAGAELKALIKETNNA